MVASKVSACTEEEDDAWFMGCEFGGTAWYPPYVYDGKPFWFGGRADLPAPAPDNWRWIKG
jgi:hypothetical protein